MRVAIYARISRDNSGISENVDIQIMECRRHAEDRGWTVVSIFHDNDITASKYSTKPRPGYATMITALKNDDIEAVLVAEMSRLYRRIEELLELIKLAEASSLNTSSPLKKVTAMTCPPARNPERRLRRQQAVYESRRMSDRVKRKFRARAEQAWLMVVLVPTDIRQAG